MKRPRIYIKEIPEVYFNNLKTHGQTTVPREVIGDPKLGYRIHAGDISNAIRVTCRIEGANRILSNVKHNGQEVKAL